MITSEASLFYCFLFGGIVSADSDAAWQTMISQPLVACSVAGALLGNVTLGLTVGVLMQLPFLAEIPVGGVRLSQSNLASFVAALLALRLCQAYPGLTNSVLFFSLFLGVFFSWVGALQKQWLRQINLFIAVRAERAVKDGHCGRLPFYNYLGVFNAFLSGCLFVAIFFALGVNLLPGVLDLMDARFERAFSFAKPILLGAGLGAVLKIFVKRKTVSLATLGAALSTLFVFMKG